VSRLIGTVAPASKNGTPDNQKHIAKINSKKSVSHDIKTELKHR
jgi:hypothetical protein